MALRLTSLQRKQLKKIQKEKGIKKPVRQWSFNSGDLVQIYEPVRDPDDSVESIGIVMNINSSGYCEIRTGSGVRYIKITNLELLQKANLT